MRLKTTDRYPLLMLLLFIFGLGTMFAQNVNTGEIRGTVTDSSGAVVADAAVTITNVGTGLVLHTKTGDGGFYDLPSVPMGVYSVAFRKEGFKQVVLTGITVKLEVMAVDGTLQVGAITEQVTVEGKPPLVQTESSERSSEISPVMVNELPNVGGSWYNEVVVAGASAMGTGAAFSGAQPYESNFLMDGGFSTFPQDQNPDVANDLPLDSIAEVQVITSNFDAQYGNGSSVFNLITKNGTNQWHGSLHEYFQNNDLEARNYFASNAGTLRWNMFGGTLGGPIKRDKLFFFYSYQRRPTRSPDQGFFTFPTEAAKQGIFTDPGFPTIYDPATTCGTGSNPACALDGSGNPIITRQAFPGNIIPSNRIDPVAAKIQGYFPKAQNQSLLHNNYFANLVLPNTTQWNTVRLDANLSSKNRFAGSFLYEPGPEFLPDPRCPMNCGPVFAHELHITASDTWTLSPALLAEFHFATIDFNGGLSNPTVGAGYPAKLGMINAAYDQFPGINIGGTLPTEIDGGTTAYIGEAGTVPSAAVTWQKGKHQFKFGGEYDQFHDAANGWGATTSGNFDFNGIFTRNPADPNSSGVGYADFLLGLPDTWSATEQPVVWSRAWNTQLFAQDAYKIKPSLTVQIGLRFLRQSGWYADGNEFASFDPTITNPATGTLGAMWFAQNSHNGRTALQDTQNGWAPRLGFAWSPKQNWAIRGAYGIFDTFRGQDNYATGGLGQGTASTGFETSTDQITPIFSLSGPLPSLIKPNPATLTPDLLNGQNVFYFPRKTPLMYMEQAHLDVQHQFKGFVADVGYVWTKGEHLAFLTDTNQVPENLLGPGDAQSRRPYPQFAGISSKAFNGSSNYNALQVSLRKDLAKGFTLTSNYTYSKSLDTGTSTGWSGGGISAWQNAFDIRANYGPSDNDVRHYFNTAVVYQLPFGKGKALLNQGGIANAVIGGWQVSSIVTAHSGRPFTPYIGTANLSGSLDGTWYPNRVGSSKVANPTIQEWFNPLAFAAPAPFTFGTAGRNYLYGPRFFQADLSLAKEFLIPIHGEGVRFQLRADAFNAFNHTNFGQPYAAVAGNSNPTQQLGGSGGIFSAYQARNVQVGALVTF